MHGHRPNPANRRLGQGPCDDSLSEFKADAASARCLGDSGAARDVPDHLAGELEFGQVVRIHVFIRIKSIYICHGYLVVPIDDLPIFGKSYKLNLALRNFSLQLSETEAEFLERMARQNDRSRGARFPCTRSECQSISRP